MMDKWKELIPSRYDGKILYVEGPNEEAYYGVEEHTEHGALLHCFETLSEAIEFLKEL